MRVSGLERFATERTWVRNAKRSGMKSLTMWLIYSMVSPEKYCAIMAVEFALVL